MVIQSFFLFLAQSQQMLKTDLTMLIYTKLQNFTAKLESIYKLYKNGLNFCTLTSR